MFTFFAKLDQIKGKEFPSQWGQSDYKVDHRETASSHDIKGWHFPKVLRVCWLDGSS